MIGVFRIRPWLALVLALLLVAQTWRLAKVEILQSKQAETQAQKAKKDLENRAHAMLEHGTVQQEKIHEYTQNMAAMQAGRIADAVRITSLQHDIRSAATHNAQLAGDVAACRDLADQHRRLAALAGEGAELVGELGDLVKKRDVQVDLLQGQVAVDRVLIQRLQ